MTIRVDPDWWKTMFDEVYLLTDARSVCDEDITRREVDLICELLPIHPGQNILDLCGGHGRHSLELCARGFERCTLVDYSEVLIERGKARAAECNYPVIFIQADARKTGLPSDGFNHVLIMGNSLGYAVAPEADRQILDESHRVLCPGGWLLIDLADGAAIRKGLNPEAWHEIGQDILVCRRREMDGGRVHVREIVLSKKDGLIRDRTYAIRFYEHEGIVALLDQSGFKDVKIITDFSPHQVKGDYGFMSCRMIALGRKV